jgi:hypothetical protein
MNWRACALLIFGLAGCTSFTTGSSSQGGNPGNPGDGPRDAATDAADQPDGGGDGGGGCLQPFTSRFTGSFPLFDGFHRDAYYGDHASLSLTSVAGGGEKTDGALSISMNVGLSTRGHGLVRVIGSGGSACAKVGVHMRVVMNVHKHTTSNQAVLVMLARFEKQRDLLIGLNAIGHLEVAQQDLSTTPSKYETLGSYPISLDNWHTINVSLDPEGEAGLAKVSASVNSGTVTTDAKPVFTFEGPREFHIGVLYAIPAANAAYEIDEASIF